MRIPLFLFAAVLAQAQYDLVLKGGHVIDPANNIDGVRDIAVTGGRIAKVAAGIPAEQGRKVIDAAGLYVTPGLIDLHAHVFGYSGSIAPDDTSLVAGTTTVVDAGGAGWRTFDEMKKRVIDSSRTRVLSFLNIVGHGMIGQKYEDDVGDMDPDKTAAKIGAYRKDIVGIKVAHFGGQGWAAIDRAIAAGSLSKTPVMVDDKIFTNSGRTTREKLLDKMRPGDIHTHMYNDRQIEVVDRFSGKVQPWMEAARRRGVLFDLGHGGGSFLWPVAAKAVAQGFAPDTISTDLHSSSIMIPESDMPNCISKLMSLGMTLQEGILRSTVNPAKAIGRFPELGTLGEGSEADIAVFRLRTGVFAFKDAWQNKRLGVKKLDTVLTIRAGKVVFESESSAPISASQDIYDVLLKNGTVVDPAKGRNERLDIAIAGGQVRKIASIIPARQARRVVDVGGYSVTPGLIDLKMQLSGPNAVVVDHNALRHGVTTAVDAAYKGGKGERVQTRVLAVTPNAKLAEHGIFTGLSRGTERNTMTNVLSRLLVKGMVFEQLIERTTVNAAKAIGRTDLGTIAEGGVADIAVFEIEKGRGVRCVLTIRNGRVVWDTEGLSLTEWQDAGPYSNFK